MRPEDRLAQMTIPIRDEMPTCDRFQTQAFTLNPLVLKH
jgi:hypothetical protein